LIKIPYNLRIWITKLRTTNLKILIETGRWRNIPVEERICNICNENIGDEFHYLFICKSPELVRISENLIPEYYTQSIQINKNYKDCYLIAMLIYINKYHHLSKNLIIYCETLMFCSCSFCHI